MANSFIFLMRTLFQTGQVFLAAIIAATIAGFIIIYGFNADLSTDDIATIIAVPLLALYLLVRLFVVAVTRYAQKHPQPERPERKVKRTMARHAFVAGMLCAATGFLGMLVMIPSVGGYYVLGMTWAIAPGLIVMGVCVMMWAIPLATHLIVRYLRSGGILERIG